MAKSRSWGASTAGALASALVALAAVAVPAAAEQTTLGIADAAPQIQTFCATAPYTVAQTSLAEGIAAAPANGRITSWWAASSFTAPDFPAKLRVLERVFPLTQVKYRGVGTSASESINTTVTHNETDLAVGAGDVVGLTAADNCVVDEAFPGEPGSDVDVWPDSLPDGASEVSTTEEQSTTLEFGALLFLTPAVTNLAAGSGSTAGGETVTIDGKHLTESTAVRFGSTAAPDFTIDSNTRITATAPAQPAGTVDVTVTGPGGTSSTSSLDQYTFVAPSATVSPAVLDFGGQLVGGTSAVRPVTLTNTGSVPVVIGAVTLGGAGGADFTTLSDGCSGHSVVPGGSCSVTLVFTPSGSGARHAALHVADNASDGPHTIVLTGSGTTPTATTISCAPATVTIPAATKCTVTVSDTGATPSPLGGAVGFGSSRAGSFTSGGSCTPAPSGAAASSCRLSFTPSVAGDETIAASYSGDATHTASNGSTGLTARRPSDAFTLSRPRLNERAGTATLVAKIPGPGSLTLKGKALKKLTKTAGGAGRVKLAVEPARDTRRKLDQSGEAKVVASVTYTPTSGDPNTESKRLVLKLKSR